MDYRFDHQKLFEKVIAVLERTELNTDEVEIISPLNPDVKIGESDQWLGCQKCDIECTGCTGGCTVDIFFH